MLHSYKLCAMMYLHTYMNLERARRTGTLTYTSTAYAAVMRTLEITA